MKTLILLLTFAGLAVSQSVNNGASSAISGGTISLKEDFFNFVPPFASANGLIGTYGWSTIGTPAGTGSIASVSGGVDLNHAGIVQLGAGPAVGDTAVLYLGDLNTSHFPFPDPGSTTNWTAYWVWKPANVAVHNHGVGLTNFGTGGLYVFLNSKVSPNFLFVVQNVAGGTSFDTGIAATATDWWSLKLWSPAVGFVIFQLYKNGLPIGAPITGGVGQTINHALPTGKPLTPFFQASSEAAQSMTVLVDYFEFSQSGLVR
jgi:hypothetical protein